MVLWALLFGCGALEGACTGLGFGEACTEPATPLPGPWVADVGPDPLCGVDGDDLGEGWVVGDGDAFTLAPPGGDAVECGLDADSFACGDAVVGEVTIALAGTFTSRSTADLSLRVTDGTCDVTVDVPFVAAWKAHGPPHGACPDKYDEYGADPDQPQVSFTVRNASASTVGLFAINDGSDTLVENVAAGGDLTSTTYQGGWMALATDWGEDNCLWFFQVRQDGQIEVYEGE